MKRVQFWQVGDTVVSTIQPAHTWEVVQVKNLGAMDVLDWARISNAHSTISGNVRSLQQQGFVGYRAIKEV